MIEKHRILIVDDEEDIVEFLHFNFQKEGFEVRTANDGKEAVELALNFRPQIILMDIMMPVMDGIEASREIRKNSDFYYPIICMLSARGEDYSQIAAFDAGADDFVMKPVSPKVIVSRMKALLNIKFGKSEVVAGNGENNGEIFIDRDYYSVFKNKEEIRNSTTSAKLLRVHGNLKTTVKAESR